MAANPSEGAWGMDEAIGERFARALAAKDRPALVDVLAPDVDFRGLTPGRAWEAASAAVLVDDVLLGAWFDGGDRIDGLEDVEHGSVADRERVAYRLRVTNGGGTFLVEQQAYFAVVDGRISWLRVLCSGFRPVGGDPAG